MTGDRSTEETLRGLPSALLVQAIDDALDAAGMLVTLREQADHARKACRPGAHPSTMAEDTTTTDATTGEGPGQAPGRAEVKKTKRQPRLPPSPSATTSTSFGSK